MSHNEGAGHKNELRDNPGQYWTCGHPAANLRPPPPACAPGGRRSHQPVGTPLCLKNSQSGQKTTCSWGPFMITKMQAPCGSCEYMSLPSNPGSKVLAIHRTFSSLQVKIKQLPVSWRALVSTSSMAKFVETTTSTQRKRVLFGKGRY